MIRMVVVQLWTGAREISRLGPGDPDPTPEELDSIAVAWTPWNDGVMPTVRVLEAASMPGWSRGPAGTVPRKAASMPSVQRGPAGTVPSAPRWTVSCITSTRTVPR